MVDSKKPSDDNISTKYVKSVIDEFKRMMQQKVNEIDARIQSEKYTAPESYINDLKGFSRGMSVMGIKALEFFRERLLKNDGK